MQGGFDLGGVRENGEERAYQIARSIEPTPGSPLAPGREISSTRCTRKDVRRGGTLAWGQEDARERGEGNHLMRRRRLQGHRRRKAVVARLEEEIKRRRRRRHFRFGASRSRARDEATRDGRTGGLLPDVRRPGLIPRGYRAHPGRKSQCSRLPKSHVGLHVEGFRVGCRPREMTGIPAGKWTSKLGLRSGRPPCSSPKV